MMEINAIVFVLLLVIALAVGAVVAWFVAFSKGKQLVENKFEQLGKDAKKIIDMVLTFNGNAKELMNLLA